MSSTDATSAWCFQNYALPAHDRGRERSAPLGVRGEQKNGSEEESKLRVNGEQLNAFAGRYQHRLSSGPAAYGGAGRLVFLKP